MQVRVVVWWLGVANVGQFGTDGVERARENAGPTGCSVPSFIGEETAREKSRTGQEKKKSKSPNGRTGELCVSAPLV